MNARRLFTPLRLAVAGIFALVVAVIVLLSTSSSDFLIVPDRAHPLAELVKVPGGEHRNVKGGIYYVDVL